LSELIILKPLKVLAIQFKYLGDAVILTPALKALKTQMPNVELHVLVAVEVAPLLENLSWISKVWAMPRQRGKFKLKQSLPFIQALRREKFDRSVDFGGNDRGALLSYLCGAKDRLGFMEPQYKKLMQWLCYTKVVSPQNPNASYYDLHFELLRAWNIKRPSQLKIEVGFNDCEVDLASALVPENIILCHISTSQAKKDWPISHWQELYNLALQERFRLVFSAGPNQREQNLLDQLKSLLPHAETLPSAPSLRLFLSILKRSKIFISGDTGPLHFASGLGIPILGIFGVGNSIRQVAPIYSQDELICADNCACDLIVNNTAVCQSSISCMSRICPEDVFKKLKNIIDDLK